MDKERIDRFEQLIAWQKARALASRIYLTTMSPPMSKDFTFVQQIRRAALSVPSNIAEGFERGGRAEFQHFLSIAKASCAEVRTQLYVASDIGYLDQPTFSELMQEAEEVSRIIGGLRRAVQQKRTQSSVLSPQS